MLIIVLASCLSAQGDQTTEVSDCPPGDDTDPTCLGLPLESASQPEDPADRNINGEALALCSRNPLTGYYRDGSCRTGPTDRGVHVVCAEVTDAFLRYSASQGNNLMTPSPAYGFPGLKDGDRWCLCAVRWEEARQAGLAPPVVAAATHARALDIVAAEDLQSAAIAINPPAP